MTQQEYEKEIDDLLDRLEALKLLRIEMERPTQRPSKYAPEFKDDYWYVGMDGDVNLSRYYGNALDQGSMCIGNMFATYDEAEFMANRLRVLNEMNKYAGKPYDPVIIECIKGDSNVHIINCSPLAVTSGEIHFATRADAEECIQAIGKHRLRKYYFLLGEEV